MSVNFRNPIHTFEVVDEKFAEEFYKMVVEDGWSVSYASRIVRGGITSVRRNLVKYPKLKEAYNIYLEKMKKKPALGYAHKS